MSSRMYIVVTNYDYYVYTEEVKVVIMSTQVEVDVMATLYSKASRSSDFQVSKEPI